MFHHTQQPTAVPISLRGILREHGELFVAVALGAAEQMVEDVELRDLATFENFRRLVLARFGKRCVYRRGQWLQDVVAAAERGGLTVEIDHAAKTIWFDQCPLAFAEAGYIAELPPVVRFEAEATGASR